LSEVRLRPATGEDEPLLRTLFVAGRPDLALLPLPPEQLDVMVEMQWRAQRTGYAAEHPAAADLVVERGSEPVGRVLVDPGPPVTVVDLAVLPECRGQGVGEAALRWVLDGASELGVPTRLRVRPDNPARRLYDRLGFVVVDQDEANLTMVREPER
jgi:ribosomal protein S18 acetylase RimI-like enzyme